MTEEPRLPESRLELAPDIPLREVSELGSLRDLDDAVDRLLAYSDTLVEQRERYRSLFHDAPMVSLVTDVEGVILEANVAATELFQRPLDGLVGEPLSRLVRHGSRAPFDAWLPASEEGTTQLELRCAIEGSASFTVAASVARGGENGTSSLHWILHDVTERARREERSAQRPAYDGLTGLPNGRLFREMLRLAIARAHRRRKRIALVSVDLDGFSLVNDSLGRAAGDVALCEFAGRLRVSGRADDVVGRLGGDAFAMLLADDLPDDASSSADPQEASSRIRRSLEEPFLLADVEVHMTASTGFCIYPTDAASPRTLLGKARRAMDRTKAANPGRSPLLAAASWSSLHQPQPPITQLHPVPRNLG